MVEPQQKMTDRSEPPKWSIIVGIIVALGMIFLLGVGCGQQWAANQWGPFAAWLSGAATFGAVFVALREAARSQRARESDHEISRRRECVTAPRGSLGRSHRHGQPPLKPSLSIWMVLILNSIQKSSAARHRLWGR